MKATLTPSKAGSWATSFTATMPAAESDTQVLSFTLELESSSALLTVLTTVARLGCQLTFVHATGQSALLRVEAPQRVAHRVRPCLGVVIGVVSVEVMSEG